MVRRFHQTPSIYLTYNQCKEMRKAQDGDGQNLWTVDYEQLELLDDPYTNNFPDF